MPNTDPNTSNPLDALVTGTAPADTMPSSPMPQPGADFTSATPSSVSPSSVTPQPSVMEHPLPEPDTSTTNSGFTAPIMPPTSAIPQTDMSPEVMMTQPHGNLDPNMVASMSKADLESKAEELINNGNPPSRLGKANKMVMAMGGGLAILVIVAGALAANLGIFSQPTQEDVSADWCNEDPPGTPYYQPCTVENEIECGGDGKQTICIGGSRQATGFCCGTPPLTPAPTGPGGGGPNCAICNYDNLPEPRCEYIGIYRTGRACMPAPAACNGSVAYSWQDNFGACPPTVGGEPTPTPGGPSLTPTPPAGFCPNMPTTQILWCATFNCPNGDTTGDGQCNVDDQGGTLVTTQAGDDCPPPASGCGQIDMYYQGAVGDLTQANYCGHTYLNLSCGGGGPSPTPAPVPPTASMTAVCTPPTPQTAGDLSYTMTIANINPSPQTGTAVFVMCMSHGNAAHQHLFTNFFGGIATWNSSDNTWFCYHMGAQTLTSGMTSVTRPFDDTLAIGGLNSTHASWNTVRNRDSNSNNRIDINDLSAYIAAHPANVPNTTTFNIKANLTVNGVFNDQIFGPNIRIYPAACGVVPSPTPVPLVCNDICPTAGVACSDGSVCQSVSGQLRCRDEIYPNETDCEGPPPPQYACMDLEYTRVGGGSGEPSQLGQQVTFQCEAGPNTSALFEFRQRHRTSSTATWGGYQTLNPSTIGSSTSAVFTFEDPGEYQVQCRACQNTNGTTCTAWETL